ncbi:DNA-binding transcriptional LysR family regulator [Mumia flava]|uniref:DNA-binding transcriptional LysR family regulator n=1 Tax=Mumia flava TaxID=1348852 RepID=A0A0B2BCX2_9ACTN|nr:LysR substrate-binding domain-containing protein [Mumia flava]PJJ58462.1 DNA-binding transcriptional LysR family regulator [Mumia flava]
MQIQQLAYFVAVARTRHFTHAADECGVSQPSLSKQIRVLENSLGTALFVRERGAVSLTPAGEALLPHAQEILIEVDEGLRAVREVSGLQRGRVRIGATPSMWDGLMSGTLAAFRAAHPGIELEVTEGGSRTLTRGLGRGDLDLALVIVPLRAGDPDLVATPLLRERLVLARPAGTPSRFGDDPIAVADLEGVPLVTFREGYDLRDTTTNACLDAGFEPTLAIEGGEMGAVLRFVEDGLGYAVVPPMVLASRPGLRGTPIERPRLTRTIALAHRRTEALPLASQAFRRMLVEHLGATADEPGGPEVDRA